jgi:pSer/pThr/pTyr-binding forkhead associated (FHA) protein
LNEVKLLKYRIPEVPRQTGEVGRLRILKGAEVGATFVLKASSISIGRGNEVDLMINDLKASRSHARLDFTKDGWLMSDLGSANGIFFQGEYIRKFNVRSGEHFTVGETIFEFLTSDEVTRALVAPLRNPQELERQDSAMRDQRLKVQGLAQGKKAATSGNPAAKKKENTRTLLLVVALAGGYYYMNMMDAPQAPKAKSAEVVKKEAADADENRALASYLPSTVGKDIEKTSDQYYWQGFREYMKGNYMRAKDDFELALQVNPAHTKARHYLASAEKESDDEVKRLTEAARQAKAIGRNQDAKGQCETVIRHLYSDRTNPSYADCEELLKGLNPGGEP